MQRASIAQSEVEPAEVNAHDREHELKLLMCFGKLGLEAWPALLRPNHHLPLVASAPATSILLSCVKQSGAALCQMEKDWRAEDPLEAS